eukprot:2500039-Prymnesium_polylepis.1
MITVVNARISRSVGRRECRDARHRPKLDSWKVVKIALACVKGQRLVLVITASQNETFFPDHLVLRRRVDMTTVTASPPIGSKVNSSNVHVGLSYSVLFRESFMPTFVAS